MAEHREVTRSARVDEPCSKGVVDVRSVELGDHDAPVPNDEQWVLVRERWRHQEALAGDALTIARARVVLDS